MTLTPPDPAWYSVTVTAGDYSWTVDKGDPAAPGLADPLTVAWSVPENGLTYAQPNPMQATFTLWLASMSDIGTLDVGDPVAIFVTLDPGLYPSAEENHLVSFRGRVASMPMRPRQGGGVLVSVLCVDYTVDLAESAIGTDPWPAETTTARTARIALEAGIVTPPTWNALIGGTIALAARTGGLTDARAQLVRLVDTAGGAAGGGYKYFLIPNYPLDATTDTAPDPLKPFDYWVQKVTENNPGGQGAQFTLPGSFQLIGARWGIVAAGLPADDAVEGLLNADYVDLATSWLLSKNDRPDTVVVVGPYATPTAGVTKMVAHGPAPVPITTKIDTDLTDWQDGGNLATLNVTTQDSDRWAPDDMTFYADLDPTRLTARGSWFNDATFVQALQVPLVVSPIPEDQNPTGVDWLAGCPVGATFTLAGGRFRTTLRLNRNLPAPTVQAGANLGYLAPANLTGAPYAAITYADLDPRFSYYDYRIARNPHA